MVNREAEVQGLIWEPPQVPEAITCRQIGLGIVFFRGTGSHRNDTRKDNHKEECGCNQKIMHWKGLFSVLGTLPLD